MPPPETTGAIKAARGGVTRRDDTHNRGPRCASIVADTDPG